MHPGGIRTRVFSFQRRMRCPLRHAARAPKSIYIPANWYVFPKNLTPYEIRTRICCSQGGRDDHCATPERLFWLGISLWCKTHIYIYLELTEVINI
jgi:hypothetical protein